MIKIMNGKPVIVDEDGKTRVLFDNLPGDIGGTPGYNELLEDVQNLMDYVYGTDVYTENKTPYFFRASGGGVDVGICENDTLVGGSVGWNQLVPNTGSSLSVTVTSGHKYVMKKSGTLSVGSSSGSALTGLTGGSDMVTDLTLCLGSAVADRVYTLEQSTAGSGIAQLRAWGFDFGTYIPFCAPTLKHVEGVSAHVMRDANDNIIGNYPLDATLTLRGVPKLDSNNSLYYDGDTYEPDGTVTRKYGIMDLGQMGWTFDNNSSRMFTTSIAGIAKGAPSTSVANLVCARYSAASNNDTYSHTADKIMSIGPTGNMYVYDTAYTDATTFKTAMSGVYLVYELATEETEQATPYTEYQEVDASGTEEYISTGVVPVGHDTKYPTDLKGKLEQILEGVPTTDGTYVLTATVSSGKATYSWESTSSAKTSVKEPIDTLEKEVVEKPSEEEPVEEPVEEEQPVEEVTEEPVDEEQEEEQPVEETDE